MARAKPAITPAAHRPEAGHRPEPNGSFGRALDILGDGWSLLILRESHFGRRRFEDFRSALGLPRGTLAVRLRDLVDRGLLKRLQYSERPARFEYRLTPMGFDLYPVMLALLAYGDKWLGGDRKPPLQVAHIACGNACRPIVACTQCGDEIHRTQLFHHDAPSASRAPSPPSNISRRGVDSGALERRQPCSIARALGIIGDRWSVLVVGEALLGACRFDDWQTRLNIAPNILADRLKRFVHAGIFERIRYRARPDRFEYRLSEMGGELVGPIVTLLRWGDRWLSDERASLVFAHRNCGSNLVPMVICDHCHLPLTAAQMRYHRDDRGPSPD